MQKNITLLLSSAVFIFIALAFWFTEADHDHEHAHGHGHGHDHEHEPQEFVVLTDEQIAQNGIKTQLADKGSLQKVIRAPSKIKIHTDYLVHVFPKVAGNALEARKNLGEKVEANEILATLESREIAETKAAYLASLKKERLTAYCFNREKNLFEKRISAEEDYHHAKHECDEARINLELNRQKLHALGLQAEEILQLPNANPADLRFYELRSPIAGTIIHRHISPGEFIDLEHEVFVVADLNKVWAEMNVFPQDLEYLSQGQEITITSGEGKTTQAKLIYVSPIIDEDTRTATAIAEINNESGKWCPGAFACACLAADLQEFPIVIPKEAIQKIDNLDSVFVVTPEGFRPRPVIIGQSDEQNCEIICGLEQGEEYASQNTFLLKADLKKEEAEHVD